MDSDKARKRMLNYVSARLAMAAMSPLSLMKVIGDLSPRKNSAVREIVLDEKRFGRASESERKATLGGRRGKLPKSKRKALNQRLEAQKVRNR